MKLDDFSKEVGSGPFWITGKFIKRLIDFLAKDRVRVADGGALQEMQTPSGRIIYLGGQDFLSLQRLTFTVCENGAPTDFKIPATRV